MKGLSQKARETMTVAQRDKLAEERDCPACSGILKRIEVYKDDDSVYVERYHHHGGNPDCDGNDDYNGFLSAAGQYVVHYRGYSEGGGILEGEI